MILYSIAMIFVVSPNIEEKITSLEKQVAQTKLDEMLTIVRSTSKELEDFRKNSIKIHKQELKNIISIAESELHRLYDETKPENISKLITSQMKEFLLLLANKYKELQGTHSKKEIEQILIALVQNYSFDEGIGRFEIQKLNNLEQTEPFQWNLIPVYDYAQKVKHSQNKAQRYFESLVYGENEYLFVIDYDSYVIAHPKFHGKDFSQVKDKKGSLIVPPMVEVARKFGEGFYSYWWPRLGNDKTLYEKLSYSKDFRPWSWVLGTGLYLVDIDKEQKKKQHELINQLRAISRSTTIAKDGSIYIFDAKGNIVVHKNAKLEKNSIAHIKNELTNRRLFQDLINAYQSGKKELHYRTDSDKMAWIEYNKEFDWYICADVDMQNLLEASMKMKEYVWMIALALFLIAFVISLYFFKKLLKPVEILSQKAQEVKNGDITVRSGIKADDEIGILAATFDEMLQKIEENIHTLDEQVKEKTKKVTTLLDNAGQGFLSFGKDLIIDPEYSKECQVIFEKDIAFQKIDELLYPQDKEEEKILYAKIIGDLLDQKISSKKKRVFLNLAPKEFEIMQKKIHIAYKLIEDERIMLILTDVTEQKALEQKISTEKQRLKMVVSVVRNINEFKEVVDDYYRFCESLHHYLLDEKQLLSALTEIYRAVHTFKGNFAQKDLIHIVPKLHNFESSLNEILKNPNRNISSLASVIKQNNIELWLDEDLSILQDVLGDDFLSHSSVIKVNSAIVEELEQKMREIIFYNKEERDTTYEELLGDIQHLSDTKLTELLSSYPKMITQLAQRLGKQINDIQIIGDLETKVPESYKAFTKTLVHVFRNSIDHGIESVDERIAKNKQIKANITCLINENDKSISLCIIDDGKGIDAKQIAKKAYQKRLVSKEKLLGMKKSEILSLIFLDNLSTKEEVSDLSGRGVGLAAVKSELDKLGGRVIVSSAIDKGTTFRFILPKR